MNKKIISKKSLLAIIAISTLSTTNVIADNNSTKTAANSNISSTGGLMLGSKTDPYWFQLSGAIKFDQMAFMGNAVSKGTEFHSGANFRGLEIDFGGGLGKDISYTLMTIYEPKDKKIKLDDAYLTYAMAENFTVSAGQVLPGFSLESTASGKWIPFFERSIATHALGTNLGLGVNVSKWSKDYTFIVAAMQPKQDTEAKDYNGASVTNRDDRWQTSARMVYRPIYEGTKILQLGASGYFYDDHSSSPRFKTFAEATDRNHTDLIDTGYTNMTASNHKAIDVEIAGQNGPLYGEVEYERVFVTRPAGASKLHFHGYHVLASYVLTGEAKAFKEYNGTFGQVKPFCPKGAWEIAARYSMLNLNDKNIHGGRGNNTSLALNYYVNNNVRISGEYIRSILHPSTETLPAPTVLANTLKRKLNIFGIRLQAVF